MTAPRMFLPDAERADEITQYFTAVEKTIRADGAWPLVQAISRGDLDQITRTDWQVKRKYASMAICSAIDLLWRHSRVAYPVHQDMLRALAGSTSTKLSGDLLRRIPHTNPLLILNEPMRATLPTGEAAEVLGAYVFGTQAEWDQDRHQRFCLTTDTEMTTLGFMGISRVLDRAGRQTSWDFSRMTIPLKPRFVLADVIDWATSADRPRSQSRPPRNPEGDRAWWATVLPPFVDAVLYTCTATPDMRPVRQRPKAAKGRKRTGNRDDRPAPTTLIKVGWQLGPSLMEARRASKQYEPTGQGHEQTRQERRGHWRETRCGPRWSEKQLDWIAPYMIRRDQPEDSQENRMVPLTKPGKEN